MTKSISSYPKSQQATVIARRLLGNDRGMGYWAAVDAKAAIAKKQKEAAA